MVSKKEKYLVSAQKFIERGQLDKALADFAKVVEEDPKDTRTWLKMAELHAKRGANAEAVEIYLRTGDLYVEQGFAQKALAVYKNVLKLAPGTVPAHLKVGTLFSQLGLLSDAVQQFELAATALQQSGKTAEAVAALTHAVDIQPDNVVLRVKLAESASHAGMIGEAVREFGKAAEQLKMQGRIDEGLRVIERLLFHEPGNFTKARELAEAYIARGTPRLALPKLQACLNGDPRDPRTLSLLARALEQLGQVPKAVSVLKELVRLCQDLGRSSERDAAVLRGLTLDPTDGDLLAAAARYQPRAVAAAAGEATPPPVPVASVETGRIPGGSFEHSGAVRTPTSGGVSGRVLAALGPPEGNRRHTQPPAAGPKAGSAADVARVLAEADVFVKYGLLERAADHLTRVFELEPEQREAREQLISVLRRLGRNEDAARHREILNAQLATPGPAASAERPVPRRITTPGSGPALAPPVLFEALWGSGPDQSLGIAIGDDPEPEDPAAYLMTPPPVAWEAAAAMAAEPHHTSSVVAANEFDAEIRTGDVLTTSAAAGHESDIEFFIDNASDDVSDDVESGGPQEVDSNRGAEDDDLDTPRLERAPMVISPFHQAPIDGSQSDEGDEDEDASRAFSDNVSTLAGDPEQVAAAFAQFDDEDLAAELDQVSFFLDQSMSEEARASLHDLEVRFPRDPRVAAKLRELASSNPLASPGARDDPGALPGDSVATSRIVNNPILGSTVIERPVTASGVTPTPRAVVGGGESSDVATHADLAIAYKGMGLFDAAIAELKLLAQDEAREVFALTTMGECFENKNSFTEAIIRYKRALNCEQVSPEETLLLYFLLGAAFERLGDISEALYFYEKVLKRQPKFRDVDLKVAELKPRLVKKGSVTAR